MKHMDWAAMGMASGAYAEASRARAEVAALWEENQRLRNDINNEKYERNFQKWIEELIYQFDKTVKIIANAPASPVDDYLDIASFLRVIDRKKLDTSHISGLENKEKFEQTILKAKRLLEKLENTREVQGYINEQEAKQMQLREEEEKRLKAKTKTKAEARKRRIYGAIVVAASVIGILLGVGIYKEETSRREIIAAKQGDMAAQFELANKCYNGIDTPINYDEAAEWYRRAAEQGHAEAQYLIGRMYYLGQGVKANDYEGRKWCQKAADQWHQKLG